MRKILFIITIGIVFMLLLFLYLFLVNLRNTPEQKTPIIPFPTQSGIQPIFPTTYPPLVEEEPLLEQIISRLPVTTDAYDIEYLSSSNTFVVTIKESPYEENKSKAQQWFLQNGFSSIEGLNILYNSYRWVE